MIWWVLFIRTRSNSNNSVQSCKRQNHGKLCPMSRTAMKRFVIGCACCPSWTQCSRFVFAPHVFLVVIHSLHASHSCEMIQLNRWQGCRSNQSATGKQATIWDKYSRLSRNRDAFRANWLSSKNIVLSVLHRSLPRWLLKQKTATKSKIWIVHFAHFTDFLVSPPRLTPYLISILVSKKMVMKRNFPITSPSIFQVMRVTTPCVVGTHASREYSGTPCHPHMFLTKP